MSEIYNANYYHSGCGPIPYEEPEHWVEFFGKIAQRIVDDFHPQTVLDAAINISNGPIGVPLF